MASWTMVNVAAEAMQLEHELRTTYLGLPVGVRSQQMNNFVHHVRDVVSNFDRIAELDALAAEAKECVATHTGFAVRNLVSQYIDLLQSLDVLRRVDKFEDKVASLQRQVATHEQTIATNVQTIATHEQRIMQLVTDRVNRDEENTRLVIVGEIGFALSKFIRWNVNRDATLFNLHNFANEQEQSDEAKQLFAAIDTHFGDLSDFAEAVDALQQRRVGFAHLEPKRADKLTQVELRQAVANEEPTFALALNVLVDIVTDKEHPLHGFVYRSGGVSRCTDPSQPGPSHR